MPVQCLSASPLLYDDDLLMPPVSSSRGEPKRPHTGDEGEKPSKRARKGSGSGEVPNGDEEASGNIVHLSDRVRFSWQSKGKWKAKSRSKSAPVSRGSARVPLDSAPSTSSQPIMAPVIETSQATIFQPFAISPPASSETQPNEQELALQAEVERLRKEVEDKNKAISRHENVIDTVRTTISLQLAFSSIESTSFSVVPCGHISCQNCLIEWFTSHASNDDAPRQGRKRKTCPHCRGAVRLRPVELFGLAPAAAALAGQSDPSAVTPAFGPVTSAADPWAKLFPVATGHPLRDEEDGVLRCPDCFHEVWDGECVRCRRVFDDESGHSAFGSDDGSISIYGDGIGSVYEGAGSLYGNRSSDEGEGDSVYGSEPDYARQAFIPPVHMYDSYEDEDDDDSFIDDSELPRPPPAAYFHHYAPSESEVPEGEQDGYHSARGGDGYRSPVADVIRVSSSDSEDDSDNSGNSSDSDLDPELDEDEEEDDFLPPRGRRGRSAETDTTAPATGIETAEEADDEEESEVDPNTTIDADPDEDDEAPIRPMGRGRRVAAAGWGWAAQAMSQNRARGRRARRIDSPDLELGSESGSEYFSE
ncbi:hypothetical protein FRC07_014938 [Ceratobasidium sp. 392]|nr:hypothetical protein FRC07_014938 [Ceratobasidium sp. 392]